MTYNEHGTDCVVQRLITNELTAVPEGQGVREVYDHKGQTLSTPADHCLTNTNLFSVYQMFTISTQHNRMNVYV